MFLAAFSSSLALLTAATLENSGRITLEIAVHDLRLLFLGDGSRTGLLGRTDLVDDIADDPSGNELIYDLIHIHILRSELSVSQYDHEDRRTEDQDPPGESGILPFLRRIRCIPASYSLGRGVGVGGRVSDVSSVTSPAASAEGDVGISRDSDVSSLVSSEVSSELSSLVSEVSEAVTSVVVTEASG